MSGVLHVSTTQRGKPSMVDINNFSYTSLIRAKTIVWDFLKLVISQEANTRRVLSVKLCRSRHSRKHRQEACGGGELLYKRVAVICRNVIWQNVIWRNVT